MDYERIYEYRFRDLGAGERAAVWVPIARYIYDRFGSPEVVLDPAAGLGEFIAAVPARERWAVDMVDHGLSSIPGVQVQIASAMTAELPTSHFDLIFASNLLEHLPTPEDVYAFLCRMRGLLRPGGHLVVMGPNFRYCAADYFDCADHILALTEKAVAEHLYAAGFDVEAIEPRFLPFSFRSRLPASPTLTSFYLKCPPAWRVLGKQFLVSGVAR
jgi:SAM-dependent methyltransferase